MVDELVKVAVESKNLVYICAARLARGELRRHTDSYDPAYRDLTLALEAANLLNRSASRAAVLSQLAVLQSERDEHASAIAFAEQLLAPEFESISRPSSKAAINMALCTVRLGANDLHESISLGERAAELYASLSRPLFHARALALLAEAHARLDRRQAAVNLHLRADAIFTRLGVSRSGLPRFVRYRVLATKKRS